MMNDFKVKIYWLFTIYMLFFSLPSVYAQADVDEEEIWGLNNIWHFTYGLSWSNYQRGETDGYWREGNDPLGGTEVWRWYGVNAYDDHVYGLFLENNNLSGSIDLSGIGSGGGIYQYTLLPYLQYLDLSGNSFSSMYDLRGFSYLSNLIELDLGSSIHGSLQGLQMEEILVGINDVVGYKSNLEILNLSGGSVYPNLNSGLSTRVFPSWIYQHKKLKELYLNGSSLSGTIPSNIGGANGLTHLEILNLGGNQLEGPIPDLTANTSLQRLDISVNKFRFVDFYDQFNVYKTKNFSYAPQAKTDTEKTITGGIGGSVTLTMFEDNRFTPDDTFQWYKGTYPNGVLISGATSRQYIITNLNVSSHEGDYYCISKNNLITNPAHSDTNLILVRNKIHLNLINCDPILGTLSVNTTELCKNKPTSFSFQSSTVPVISYLWVSQNSSGTVVNTDTNSSGTYTFEFDTAGDYTVTLEVLKGDGCKSTFSKSVTIEDCIRCEDCASFNLIKNEKYLISGWVKESNPSYPQEQLKNYDKGCVYISFTDVAGASIDTPKKFYATGEIMDGWQRIIGEFVVPQNSDGINLELVNENSDAKIAYFDDIRILPSKGNMKSFVYDQTTQRLMAELDENNYSTFYEYDLEGGLVRIKKETEKGVFTIQETRSGNTKTDQP